MNEYKDAVDVMARYISDCKIGIKRYSDRDIDNVMAKIVELEEHCNELEHELEVLKEEYNADQKYIKDFDTTKDWYWNKIKRLEKALDKACKFISGIFNDHEDEKIYWEKEDWKKYLLED